MTDQVPSQSHLWLWEKNPNSLIPLKGEATVVYLCISHLRTFFLYLINSELLAISWRPLFEFPSKEVLLAANDCPCNGSILSEVEEGGEKVKIKRNWWVRSEWMGHAPFNLEGENEMAKSTSQSVYIALSILMLFFPSHQPPSFLRFWYLS